MATTPLPVVVAEKLNSTNYVLWRSHFTAYLRGNDIMGYVDGSRPCPPRVLPDAAKTSDGLFVNPRASACC
ncbi:hypothetical protein BVC80_8983g16 [Macleaya cordata]|uniref:Retrotransposon Copia-like N-terminal domain-containing protein n=1 Tax=Macleaya cordata TaxID=56857 RepID=A0A200QJ82_MACCD|nr:hypothetical protein BVC80_8983g16 [Macleaya cordata]